MHVLMYHFFIHLQENCWIPRRESQEPSFIASQSATGFRANLPLGSKGCGQTWDLSPTPVDPMSPQVEKRVRTELTRGSSNEVLWASCSVGRGLHILGLRILCRLWGYTKEKQDSFSIPSPMRRSLHSKASPSCALSYIREIGKTASHVLLGELDTYMHRYSGLDCLRLPAFAFLPRLLLMAPRHGFPG